MIVQTTLKQNGLGIRGVMKKQRFWCNREVERARNKPRTLKLIKKN